MDTKTPVAAIKKACRIAGGLSALARAIKVKPPTVHQWLSGDRQVPSERCTDIERVTGVSCEDLRPDLAEHWAYLRGTPHNEAA